MADTRQITAAAITFHTTGEGKDGNSQVRDRITRNGQDYFQLFCCSSGNHGSDVWNTGDESTQNMNRVGPITVDELAASTFVAGLTANGNDEWHAIYTLNLTLDDGSKMSYSLGELWLNSQSSGLNEKDVVLATLTPTFG
jgi:hypothetical protein